MVVLIEKQKLLILKSLIILSLSLQKYSVRYFLHFLFEIKLLNTQTNIVSNYHIAGLLVFLF